MKSNVALSLLAAGTFVFVSSCVWAKPSLFEPADGKTLLIVGQNVEEINSYLNAAKQISGGLMGYTSLSNLEGLQDSSNRGDGTQYAQKLIDDHPDTVFQLGLWIVDDCGRIARGEMDNEIDRLGDWIASTHHPVFLRIGYEFDGPFNHYPPDDYIKAFRRIVDRFRQRHITNVAFVWHSYASLTSQPIDHWYPGDDYVDWVGISYFDQPQVQMQPVVVFAQKHDKPVIIAESSPWKIQTRWSNSWNLWFVPYFKFIRDNHIKAISYISCNWDATNQFKEQHWGDTRLEINPEVLQKWLKEISQDRYIKSSHDLFKQLGYQK